MNALPAPLDLLGWTHTYSGKVRDLYVPASDVAPQDDAETSSYLLVVASNRVSAYDHVLDPPIPGKGALLTALSNWWFSRISMSNHLAGDDAPAVPEEVADRAVVSRRLEMYPIECVVRGALTGSGYKEYLETGTVCGIKLPAGLTDGDLLDEPIYTPAFKAPYGEHDENITFEQSVELVGTEVAEELRSASLDIFTAARELAAERGIVLADTKFEFGRDPRTGELTLADEVLTSDSSRYWDSATYDDESLQGADRLASFDKQIVRNWLKSNWDMQGTTPELPALIVEQTYDRYHELYVRLTGFEPPYAALRTADNTWGS